MPMPQFNVSAWRARRATFASKRRMRFYDKLARFTSNGTPLVTAVRNLQRRYVKYKDIRAPLFLAMLRRIEEGDHLSQILAPFIPSNERLLIQSGEESGRIHEGFEAAKGLGEVVMKMRSVLWGELSHPLSLFLMLCGMLALVSLRLVPVLETAVPYEKWPEYSKPLRSLSYGVLHYGIFIIAGLGLATWAAIRSLPRWRGPIRESLDKWCPPWSLHREVSGSGFLIALSALTAAGKSVTTAVERLGVGGSAWLNVHLHRMRRTLVAGGSPGEAMRTGLFDREVEDDIEDYCDTNAFEDALVKIGKDQTTETILRIQQRAAVLRYVTLVIVMGTLLYIYSAALSVGSSVATQAMTMGH